MKVSAVSLEEDMSAGSREHTSSMIFGGEDSRKPPVFDPLRLSDGSDANVEAC